MHITVYKCSGNNVYVYIHWITLTILTHTHTYTKIYIYTWCNNISDTLLETPSRTMWRCVSCGVFSLWGRCSFLACFGGSHQPMALVESFRSLLLCWVGECNMAADPALMGWDSMSWGIECWEQWFTVILCHYHVFFTMTLILAYDF